MPARLVLPRKQAKLCTANTLEKNKVHTLENDQKAKLSRFSFPGKHLPEGTVTTTTSTRSAPCIPVHLRTGPAVYQLHCASVPGCTGLTMSQSHCVPGSSNSSPIVLPGPLCTSLIRDHARCVAVTLCPSPIVLPVTLCTSLIRYRMTVV